MIALDDAHAARHASADLLSLALIDTRNEVLRWLALFEAHGALQAGGGGSTPLWLAAHGGWYQDFWIARHVQRQRGDTAEPGALHLPPADAAVEAWICGADIPPSPQQLRLWLAETLERTLELLPNAATAAARGADPDATLHYFRLALRHEDRLAEALAERAIELQLPAGDLLPPMPLRPARDPLWLPPQTVQLGSAPGGTVPENERWAHAVAVPAFEIDAQAVSWAQYIEFAEDGGYDRREFWTEPGWAWLQQAQTAEGRRAPRHVEQLRGAVYVQRQGQMQRVAAGQPVLHVSRFEAEAWCRWAGRRLPTEPEWVAAALAGASRGFVWGDVFEWVGGSARPWPGYSAAPGALDALPADGSGAPGVVQGVLKGASWMTRPRARHVQARRFAPPSRDTMLCGFRSCAF